MQIYNDSNKIINLTEHTVKNGGGAGQISYNMLNMQPLNPIVHCKYVIGLGGDAPWIHCKLGKKKNRRFYKLEDVACFTGCLYFAPKK